MQTMTQEERTDLMVERYGEVCNKSTAARILGCGEAKVRGMLKDGRLDAACGGTMVDVRSIARYICQPRQEDFEACKRRMKERRGTRWAV